MDHASAKKIRKERAQLSCTFCRHRKLKCDRQQPCENCVKRNQSCHYATPAAHRIGKSQDGNNSAIQNRIQHLEGLVLSLMKNGKPEERRSSADTDASPRSENGAETTRSNESASSPQSRESDQALKSFGMMNVEDNTTKYIGNDHWAAILHDIEEVKAHLSDAQVVATDDPLISSESSKGPELLVGMAGPYSKSDILATLPDRATCDAVVSKYLNSAEPLCVIFHMKTFQGEYEQFWRDRYAAPTNWVSMLYSILAITTYWQTRNMNTSPQQMSELRERVDLYRRQSCKCLLLSGYLTPKKYTLEAFLMYLGTEYIRSHEIEASIWIIFGMAVRLGISMGYHRDASHFPKLSVFNGEMRRRTWAVISQVDILTSVQVGFPRMVRDVTTDTRLPGNYQDEDLDENMTSLPEPRPDTEYTKLSYQRMKGRLAKILGIICDNNGETDQSGPYEDIIRLDERLRDAYNSMPDVLRMKPMKSAIGDKASLVMRRINLELVYLKARCILHRRYLAAALADPTNRQYEFSRKAAINAATTILRHQCTIDVEIRIGGRLANDKWLISALTTNDFILAAMLICMDLDFRTSDKSLDSDHNVEEEQYQLLEKSQGVWRLWYRQGIATPKAKIALDALLIMLEKVRRIKTASNEGSVDTGSSNGHTPMDYEQCRYPPYFTGNSKSHGDADVYTNEVPGQQHTSYSDTSPMNGSSIPSVPSTIENTIQNWMAAPQDMNWTQWDQAFLPDNAGVQDFEPGLWPIEHGILNGGGEQEVDDHLKNYANGFDDGYASMAM